MLSSAVSSRNGVRTLALGMLTAQLTALLATPLLTRLYAPVDFGAYAFLLSLVAVIAPIAALRFDAAVVLPEHRDEAWQLMRMGARAAFGIAFLLAIVVWIARPFLFASSAMAGSAAVLHWLPVLLLGAALFQLGAAWCVRERAYATASRGRAAQGVATALAQISIGFSTTLSGGLLLGDLLGRLSALLVLMRGISLSPLAVPSVRGVALIRQYRGFATYSSAAALLNALNGALPMLVVGTTLGLKSAGMLVLAQRVASAPAMLLASAVSQVFAADLARAPDVAARSAIYRMALKQLALFALPVFSVILVFAPFFGVVFGEEWRSAGVITAALVPFYASQSLSAGTIVALDVVQAHRERLVREVVFLIGMIAVLTGAANSGISLAWLAAAISAFGVLFYASSIRWVGKRIGEARA